jgi:hypothetical protein
MTIEQAMASAATENAKKSKLLATIFYYDEEERRRLSNSNEEPFPRYFVPNYDDEMNVTNLGQQLQRSSISKGDWIKPSKSRCETNNCVRLV